MAATRLASGVAAVVGGTLAAGSALAVDLPEDRAEVMYHLYDGGGTRASGPAVLVRKSMLDRVSLSAGYYVDAVSNASIDVVTTASPYKETRNEIDLGADYVVRDTLIKVSGSKSKEPDYLADTLNVDLTQDVFGGMTTVALGFTKGNDKVGEKDVVGWIDKADHWQYRLGLTQILTSRWIASANLEAVDDDGYLGSPYRLARVAGVYLHEQMPRTRESRALKLGVTGDISGEDAVNRSSIRAEYRYFWDTWNVRASTMELGYSRHLGPGWLADGFLRYYTQQHALFYSDDAVSLTQYFTRNRQLSTFHDIGLGGKVTYTLKSVPGKYDVHLTGSYELISFHYKDFTDPHSNSPYAFNAHVLQAYVSATF